MWAAAQMAQRKNQRVAGWDASLFDRGRTVVERGDVNIVGGKGQWLTGGNLGHILTVAPEEKNPDRGV